MPIDALTKDIINCSHSRNDTYTRERNGGWEGIPFNVVLNTSFFLVSTLSTDHCVCFK